MRPISTSSSAPQTNSKETVLSQVFSYAILYSIKLILKKFLVFLRALEYFRGILFITTNRVGTFDDAFISRIHVALYYPPLVDRDRVLIWENNFRRLEKDSNIKVPDSTRIYTRYDEGLRLIRWNGREIRNGRYFQKFGY
jgi:hypothetical protein